MDYRSYPAGHIRSPTRNNIVIGHQRTVLPKAGYIRDRVTDRVNDIKDLLAEHEQNTATKLIRAKADIEHLSNEKIKARRQ